MTRYAAFLRGIMPTNCTMPDLKRAFEAAGFDDVKTLLSSGNVLFSTRASSENTIEKKAEAAMSKTLGREFLNIVRSVDFLRELLESDPWKTFRLKPGTKRVVTFLRKTPHPKPALPIEIQDTRILAMTDREAFTVYVPGATKGPVFMTLIEKTFGKDVTTRTWETIAKAAR